MMSNDEWPSSRNAYTPFEEELVNAMKDFANSEDAPNFAPATVMRSVRRRTRPMVIAGVTAFFILAGGGTALAVTASHNGGGLNDRPVSATSHPAKGCSTSAAPTPVPLSSQAGNGTPAPVPLSSQPTKGCSTSTVPAPVPIASHPGSAAPVPIASQPGGATPVPIASHPGSVTPVPIASRPGAGSGATPTRLPTPAASPANH